MMDGWMRMGIIAVVLMNGGGWGSAGRRDHFTPERQNAETR
tara:strand:- start:698 stop:820 length:123 start_codon:yes stop_codon:yes gene_type:complete